MSSLKNPEHYFSGENGVYYNIVSDCVVLISDKEALDIMDIKTFECRRYFKYMFESDKHKDKGKILLSEDFGDLSKCVFLGEF